MMIDGKCMSGKRWNSRRLQTSILSAQCGRRSRLTRSQIKMLLSSYLCECVKSDGGLYRETLSSYLDFFSFFFLWLLLSFNPVLMHECSRQRNIITVLHSQAWRLVVTIHISFVTHAVCYNVITSSPLLAAVTHSAASFNHGCFLLSNASLL